jgi:nicotinic acetylcholine receptor
MKFGSWTFTGNQVSLTLYNNKDYVDLSDYWKSGTWDIIEVPAYLNVHNDSQPIETDITFYITIRRKTLFYTVNLILPTVLISFLCVLVFYLPAEAGEKVTLGISILLSLVVFLLLVSKILPPTSLVLPLIAKYLLFTFIMNTVSILVTVVIINWNFRGPRTHSMPNWIRILFLKYLPIFLFMRRPKKTRLRWMMEIPGTSRKIPPGPPPNVMNSSGAGLMGASTMPDGGPGLHGLSPPGYPQGPDKPLPPVPGGGMGGTTPPPPPVPGGHMRTGSMNDLDRKNAIEVMELSDIHHPSCKLSQSRQGSFDDDADDVDDRSPLHDMSTHSHHSHHSCHSYSGMGHQGHPPPSMPVGGGRRDSDLSDAFLSPEAYRATQAVEFIAEHLRNEDEYVQIREDWKFVAMVVDRLQLYVFFLVTTVGTIGILMDAPHIFEYVDQDKIIDIYR